MLIPFVKYQAAGNDFIAIDIRSQPLSCAPALLAQQLCDRHLGIGGDGLLLLDTDPDYSFAIHYYNADGTIALCGNGLRCMLHFAYQLGLFVDKVSFRALDGVHHGVAALPNFACSMRSVEHVTRCAGGGLIIDTGTLHHVQVVEDLDQIDPIVLGRTIRWKEEFQPSGINATFVSKTPAGKVQACTYEKGVEGITLSCGTGAVAAALALADQHASPTTVHMPGGVLTIKYTQTDTGGFENIYLEGPVQVVFQGAIDI